MTTSDVDELRCAVDGAVNDRERLIALLALAEQLCDRDYHELLALACESAELAERLGDEHRMAEALRLMAHANRSMGDCPQALGQIEHSLSLSKRLDDTIGVARATGEIGIIYHELRQHARSLEYLQPAVALAEE